MTKTMPLAVLALLLVGSPLKADEAQEKAATAAKAPTPLSVKVVFNRFQGEKKLGGLVYTLPVGADEARTEVRMGIQVPLKFEGKEYPGNVVFKSVGNTIGCTAAALGDGRFRLRCGFEQSAVYENGGQPAAAGPGAAPVLRTFSSEAILYLRDGQTSQAVVATDPLNGDVLKVDVTLTVLK